MSISTNKTKSYSMSLFHHISLPTPDPLGGGLREEIIAEQQEPEAISSLEEGMDEGALSSFWQGVEEDIHHDPEWFNFSEDE